MLAATSFYVEASRSHAEQRKLGLDIIKCWDFVEPVSGAMHFPDYLCKGQCQKIQNIYLHFHRQHHFFMCGLVFVHVLLLGPNLGSDVRAGNFRYLQNLVWVGRQFMIWVNILQWSDRELVGVFRKDKTLVRNVSFMYLRSGLWWAEPADTCKPTLGHQGNAHQHTCTIKPKHKFYKTDVYETFLTL